MRRLAGIVLAFLALSCAGNREVERSTPEASGLDGERLSLIDSVIYSAIGEGTIPGAVVSVVRGDKVAFLKAYGNRQVVPSAEPVTEGTVYDLASVTKCVGTTVAILQLVEKGQLRLTDRVDRYIPEFANWKEGRKTYPITVEHLLTHSSGLPAFILPEKYLEAHPEADADTLMHYIAAELPRAFRPGTQQLYSCLGYITLQHILENITGERLCDYVQKNVFDVLGLESTCYFPLERGITDIAATEVLEDGHVLLGEVHDPTARLLNKGNSGNAGVFSSAWDLSVIAAALLDGGAVGGRRILGPETVRLMFEIPRDIDPSVGRTLGWDTYGLSPGTSGDIFDKAFTVGHTGYTGTSMVLDLKTGTAVIILANRVHPADEGSMARIRATIANIVAGAIR